MIPNKYEFSVPTKIIFGSGVIKEAGSKAKELNAKKILIVAGENVRKAGLTKDVETSLTAVGIPYVYFSEFVPNPRDYTCNKGYEFAKKEKVDTVIAVGGGSAMDTAKAIATLLTNGGDVLDWCGADLLKTDMAPLIAIPTTAGTGSEVTPFAVVTDSKTQTKLNILDMRVTPKYALVDPHVLLNLPPHIMAATGIDAMTHAVEAYTCTVANPHTDVYALYAIRLISSNLRQAVNNPDLESCTGMMLGSNTAGIAFGFADVAAVHCMAEALGGMYDMAHGVANAVLLPTVSNWNIPANTKKYADVAVALGLDTSRMSDNEAAHAGVAELEKLCRDVGIPKLKDLPAINTADFPALAAAAAENVSVNSNPRKVSADDFLKLFKKAYEGYDD